MCYCYCKAKVCSSSVGIVYVVRLCVIFLKAALQKRGSMEPIEPPLDLPLTHQGGMKLFGELQLDADRMLFKAVSYSGKPASSIIHSQSARYYSYIWATKGRSPAMLKPHRSDRSGKNS